jgi:hypothetical protein
MPHLLRQSSLGLDEYQWGRLHTWLHLAALLPFRPCGRGWKVKTFDWRTPRDCSSYFACLSPTSRRPCPFSTGSIFTNFSEKTEKGPNFDVRVHPQSLIYHIKSSIESQHNIPLQKQEVRLDGKSLQNGRKLKYYNINSASRLTFHSSQDSADRKARKADLDAKWGRVQTTGRDVTQIFCKTLTGYVKKTWIYDLYHPQTTLIFVNKLSN